MHSPDDGTGKGFYVRTVTKLRSPQDINSKGPSRIYFFRIFFVYTHFMALRLLCGYPAEFVVFDQINSITILPFGQFIFDFLCTKLQLICLRKHTHLVTFYIQRNSSSYSIKNKTKSIWKVS